GMIAVDPEGNSLETLLEAAKKAGKSVGVVSTARITHATPACFVAHVSSRGDENEIAAQLIDYGQVDVILGGGKSYFLPKESKDGESGSEGDRRDGRNLMDEARAKGYTIVERAEELEAIRQRGQLGIAPERILGLFSMSHMAYE